jgi:ABC-type branched-subunit amino acid transport system substrate-binding protein
MGLGLGFLMCGDGVSAKEPEKYVLGGSQALSGPAYSVVIDTIVKGANLAVEEINQQGGIGPRGAGQKMELICTVRQRSSRIGRVT